MKQYQWILFDADETLFRFDAFRGLEIMFSHFNIKFTEHDYRKYQTINESLWVDYQNGKITAQQIKQQRFHSWTNQLQMSAQDLNYAFLAAMMEICTPLEGAVNLINTLQGKAKLGIITNGFVEFQQTRLERTGFNNHFDLLVISEQVGIAKPNQKIFDHALALMGNPNRENVLMVGDNPHSDIIGGINAGLDTCWLNIKNRPVPKGISPHYHVASLGELENLLVVQKLLSTA